MIKTYGLNLVNKKYAVIVETIPSGFVESKESNFSAKTIVATLATSDFLDYYLSSCRDTSPTVCYFREWREALAFYNTIAEEPLVGVSISGDEDFVTLIKTVAPRRQLRTIPIDHGNDKSLDTQAVLLAGTLCTFYLNEVKFDLAIQEHLRKLVPIEVEEILPFVNLTEVYSSFGSLTHLYKYLNNCSLFEILGKEQFLNCKPAEATHCFEIIVHGGNVQIINDRKVSFAYNPRGIRFYYNKDDSKGAAVFNILVDKLHKLMPNISQINFIKRLSHSGLNITGWYPIRDLMLYLGEALDGSKVAITGDLINVYRLCNILSKEEGFNWNKPYSIHSTKFAEYILATKPNLPEVNSIYRRVDDKGETKDDFNPNTARVLTSKLITWDSQAIRIYCRMILYRLLEKQTHYNN